MPYKSIERRREYQRKRPVTPQRRAYLTGRMKVYRVRRRREAQGLKAVPAGHSRALDLLREQMRRAQGPERDRLQAAVTHLEAVIVGQHVKPRDPAKLARRSPTAPRTKSFSTIPGWGADHDESKPTSRKADDLWMDRRLGPGAD